MTDLQLNNAKAEEGDATQLARAAALIAAPVAPVAALVLGAPLVPILVPAAVFAAIAYLAGRAAPSRRGMVIALALVGHCALFTAAFAGHAWQVDTHMAFFAVLAMVATMGSLPALIFAVVVIAVHHLSLGLLLPVLVYPSADLVTNLGRTVMHALIVLAEALVLALSILRQQKAAAEIEASRRDLAASAEEAAQARDLADAERVRALQTAELTREEGRRAAVAVEQIAKAAQAAADQALSVQRLATEAREGADRSSATFCQTITAVEAIRTSSEEISRIVEMIDEIARRTDLLALNAAVESARAGEAGRGFAVVANEVRKLAQQSADATLQIRSLVTASTGRVAEGSVLVGEAGEVMRRMTSVIAEVEVRVREISANAAEQFAGLQAMTQAIGRIDTIAVGDPNEADDTAQVHVLPTRPMAARAA